MKRTLIFSLVLAVISMLVIWSVKSSSAGELEKIPTADHICVTLDGSPVAGATVTIPTLFLGFTTSSEGCASLTNVPHSGTYCFCVSYKIGGIIYGATGSITFTDGLDNVTIAITQSGASCLCGGD